MSRRNCGLNAALIDSIGDMLPALREEAHRRAVEAAREQVRAAEQKLAKLVAGRSKGT